MSLKNYEWRETIKRRAEHLSLMCDMVLAEDVDIIDRIESIYTQSVAEFEQFNS